MLLDCELRFIDEVKSLAKYAVLMKLEQKDINFCYFRTSM